MTRSGREPTKRRPSGNRHAVFVISPEVERGLLAYLHEIEMAKGQRATWDEAFRRLLADAGRSVEEDTMQVELSEREVAQVLAALRNWQIDATNEDVTEEFAGHFEDHEPMDDEAIDALCERLNFAEGQVVKGDAY